MRKGPASHNPWATGLYSHPQRARRTLHEPVFIRPGPHSDHELLGHGAGPHAPNMSGVEEASHGARAVIPHNPIFEQLVKRKTIAGYETRKIPYILETGIFRFGSLPAIRLPTSEDLVARIRIQFPNQEGALVRTGHCAQPAPVLGLPLGLVTINAVGTCDHGPYIPRLK